MKLISNGYRDEQYVNIVEDIMTNSEFLQLKNLTHHGMNRYDHSVRVSYYSYKVAKFFKLDYEEVARGALLHDFFLNNNEVSTFKEKLITMINHPKYAIDKASEHFDLTEKQRDMILSHMFPISIRAPRYLESWVVDIMDNVASIYERAYPVKGQLTVALNVLMIVFLNYLR